MAAREIVVGGLLREEREWRGTNKDEEWVEREVG